MTRLMELTVREGRLYASQYPYADRQSCGAIRIAAFGTYTCTRQEGHDGPHVAHQLNLTAAAAWGDEQLGAKP